MFERKSTIADVVYERFLDSEQEIWGDMDENIIFFEYLTDLEMITESEVKLGKYDKTGIRCLHNHEQRDCFGPYILKSIRSIVGDFKVSGILDPKHRYILTYFLTMDEMKMIFPI